MATPVYVTACLFALYGEQHQVDLMPLPVVQRHAVGVFLEREGVGSGNLDAALADLARANGTVAYLASLPG